MEKEIIETRTSWAWMEDEHLLRVKVKDGAVVMLENAKEDVDVGRKMAKGKPFIQMLIDARGIRAISREARQYYINPTDKSNRVNRTAVAIITGSAISRVVANFFISLNKPSIPVRLFVSESGALKWLANLVSRESEAVY